jgi:uncharacterized 2Fe-2S/4Fe-4S cluster protein (DUF4445 family)
MKTEEIRVVFEPSGRTVYVLPGTKILEAAGRAGLIIQSPCGGQGTCGKCRVRVVSGRCEGAAQAPACVSAELWRDGHRLACQTTVDGAAVIDIPPESMFEHQQQILVHDSAVRGDINPVVHKTAFALPPPTIEDDRSDLARFRAAVPDVEVPYEFLHMLPGFLRAHEWKGTAVTYGRRLIAVEAGDTSKRIFGVAFDIGTTTVVGTLFDLCSGKELGVSSRMNPQIGFGDDVISRIHQVRKSPETLAQLQQAIIEAVDAIIASLAGAASVPVHEVYDIVIAGNSTMQQLLCGLDPSALGEVPFVNAFDAAQVVSAARLGIRANPAAQVYIFPQIGSFVGGDTVAGMVASRLDKWGTPVLLVDIGTNGEIVLAWNGSLLATSTAAGPAFEGARIRQGMRAAVGAIEKVIVRDGELVISVIGNSKPIGLCGTALIDAAAEMLRFGIIDETGRILEAAECPPTLPADLRSRLLTDEKGETRFVLAGPEETTSREAICLWQRDVRELQLASGAMRAGIQILMRKAGIAAPELGSVLLAGAFGNFIRRNNARRIGLLPDVHCDHIRFIGNAASLGAKLVLLSRTERAYAEALREKCTHVDLSLDAGFQDEFGMAMMFPTRDGDACS